MAGGGGGGKGGGSSGGAGGGFPIGMFANPMGGGGMYGVDPSADPQFVDASSLTDPLSTVGAALGGGDLFGGGGSERGLQAADIGGSQSDPNATTQQAAAAQNDESGTPTSALSKIAQAIIPSAHAEAGPIGPHWFEGGKGDREDKLPEAASAPLRMQTQQGGPYTNLQGPYSPPIEGGTAPVPGQDAAPILTSRIPGPAPGMPGQPPPAPQEPQPAAVEPQAPRRREAAAAPPAAPAAPPAPPGGAGQHQDPLGQLFHALGIDSLIQQMGGNYNLPEADRRSQQYGLGHLLQGVGRAMQIVGGQKPRPYTQPHTPETRSAYAPQTGQPLGGMPEASPNYKPWDNARSPQATQTGYNPQTYTRAMANIESSGNPRDRTGSNVGLYSMGPQEIRQYGDPNDPRSLARETAHHTQVLQRRLGRDPQPWELYLTHQQGIAGGPALLTANPNTPAWEAVRKFYKSDAVAKKAIHGNLYGPLRNAPVESVTTGQFNNWWQDRFNRELTRVGGDGTQTASHPSSPSEARTEIHVAPGQEASIPGARQAPDGKWYVKAPSGRYREIYAD